MFGVRVLLGSWEQPGLAEKPKPGSGPRPPHVRGGSPGPLIAVNLRGEAAERRASPESWPCRSGADKELQNTGYHGRLAKQVLKNWEERDPVSFSDFQE